MAERTVGRDVEVLGNMMKKFTPFSKEKVRDWLQHRRLQHDPLPDIKQIQHDLGWLSIESIFGEPKSAHQSAAYEHVHVGTDP